jgi:hypothetical protein
MRKYSSMLLRPLCLCARHYLLQYWVHLLPWQLVPLGQHVLPLQRTPPHWSPSPFGQPKLSTLPSPFGLRKWPIPWPVHCIAPCGSSNPASRIPCSAAKRPLSKSHSQFCTAWQPQSEREQGCSHAADWLHDDYRGSHRVSASRDAAMLRIGFMMIAEAATE